ncbi:hypothetical protein LNQ52_23135 [Klebsiella pneumoniae subsp. pneumoniae]|nr:hypothetical protein [Klebsiella pneumoniae subsp. pneumoniae]
MRIGLVELLRSAAPAWRITNYLYWPDMPFDTSEIVFSEGKRWGCASSCAGVGLPRPGGGTGSAGGAASGNLRRLYGGMSNGWSAAITTPGPSLCAGW